MAHKLNQITLNKCLEMLQGKMRINGRLWDKSVSTVYTEALFRLRQRVSEENLLPLIEQAVYGDTRPLDPAEIIALGKPAQKSAAQRGSFWEEEKPANLKPGEVARLALEAWDEKHGGEPDPPFIMKLRGKVQIVRDMPDATKAG